MKTELTIISDDLNHGVIDERQARILLLNLLGVSGSAVCPYCSGDGWTAEHDSHPHPDGDCMGMCPIQVQCPHCEGTGKVMQKDVKTAEQKAAEYAEREIPIAYTDETPRIYIEELRQDVMADYLAGYAEAMRWRDPKQELPEVGVKVLVKTSNGKYSVTEMYIYKDYSGTTLGAEWRGSYDFRMSVIGWRPIE